MEPLFEFGIIFGRGCGGHHMGAKSNLMVISQISASRQHLHTLSIAQVPICNTKIAN